MEEKQASKLKVMIILPNQILDNIELDNPPLLGDSISFKGRTYRVIEVHESMVKVGTHASFPEIGWDWVLTLG